MNTKPKAKVKNDILKISKKVLIVFAILTMILTLMGNYNNSFARSRRRKTINITSVDESYSIKNFKIDAKGMCFSNMINMVYIGLFQKKIQ